MGADLTVGESCEAKQALGDEDARSGAARLLALLKDRSRAHAVMERLPEGADLARATFQLVLDGPDGPVEQEVNVGTLLAGASILDDVVHHCQGCPANVLGAPFGCVAYVHYPIAEASERAMVDRLEPATSLGGHLALQAIADFGYDGSAIEAWRSRGLFQASTSPTKQVGATQISGNVLFQAIFGVGEQLVPTHCALVLMWMGALALDGDVPVTVDPVVLQTLVGLDLEGRATRTSLRPTGDEVADRILQMLHRAYLRDVALWVDA